MNLPFAIVGVLVLVALLAHVFMGLRETLSIHPERDGADGPTSARLERNWMQALCAFQLVSVDLLVLASFALLLAFTDVVPQRRLVANALGVFFAFWGLAWLIQLVVLRAPRRNYLLLGQWILWFVCAALAGWGARSF